MVLVGYLNETTTFQKYETLMLLSYLAKFGFSDMRSIQEKAELAAKLKKRCQDEEMTDRKRVMLLKKVWASALKVGTKGWALDARRYVADRVKSVADLVPASEHIQLQVFRTKFVVFQYWKHAFNRDLSPSKVGGSKLDCGYTVEGGILIERDEDVKVLQKTIDNCVTLCRYRGDCSTRRCSCKKKSMNCIGCTCSDVVCVNKVAIEGSFHDASSTGCTPLITINNSSNEELMAVLENPSDGEDSLQDSNYEGESDQEDEKYPKHDDFEEGLETLMELHDL